MNDNVKPLRPPTQEEQAMAYFRRHGSAPGIRETWPLAKGLEMVRDEDGLWLHFATEEGLGAAIHMDMIGPQGHKDSLVQKSIDQWCKEFVERNTRD